MQFKRELADLVIKGIKTQTRRETKGGDESIIEGDQIIAVKRNGRLLWQVGKSMAIQPGRGKNAIGRKRLKSIRFQPLWHITDADALAEGIAHISDLTDQTPRQAFAKLWDSINKKNRWALDPMVWVLEFEDEHDTVRA